ncbi:MAG TPA: acyl-CoA dehydrogenase family protein, partial [Acidimicrobiales bacterium]|nr:acyl-CoA dehydrogenase family protein [Acidimicrobiales bacterium]
MQFAFDEQQLEFRAQVRALAEKLCPPDALRASWDTPTGWSRPRWSELAALGVSAMTVPEAAGGLGLGYVDLVLVLEEAGRSGLPEPILDTVGVAVPLLLAATGPGAEEARATWLPRVADGTAVIGVAEPDQPLSVRAGVDHALVWQHGVLTALEPEEATRQERRTVDGAQRGWELDSVAPSGQALGEATEGRALARMALDRGATGAAAVLVGVADRMLTMAADYARERSQFGRAIGSFQAVKHHLA